MIHVFEGHAVATLFMAGVIWTIQLVHYPLMAFADRDSFPKLAAAHSSRITWIVAVPMLAELAGSAALVASPPEGMPTIPLRVGLGLVLVIWVSTALFQVPCHRSLGISFDATTHRTLVRTNWVRTLAWTLRSILVVFLWMQT